MSIVLMASIIVQNDSVSKQNQKQSKHSEASILHLDIHQGYGSDDWWILSKRRATLDQTLFTAVLEALAKCDVEQVPSQCPDKDQGRRNGRTRETEVEIRLLLNTKGSFKR